MSDLDKLIAAVEAGTLPEAVFHGSSSIRGHWAYTTGLDADQRRWAYLAYNCDLNAALRLHEALLPGWVVENIGNACIDGTGGWNVRLVAPDYLETFAHSTANAAAPARAWLLAILKALKAKGEAQ